MTSSETATPEISDEKPVIAKALNAIGLIVNIASGVLLLVGSQVLPLPLVVGVSAGGFVSGTALIGLGFICDRLDLLCELMSP